MKDKILLFIPCYNCEKQLPRVLGQLDDEVQKLIGEVIIVNNISTDNTQQAAIDAIEKKSWRIPVRILLNEENYGLGGSHKVAFSYALNHGFDYVIVLHGDDQGRIQDIVPLLQSGRYREYDCCLGARFTPKSRLEGYSKFRIFGNRVYNLLFSAAAGRHVYDLGSGLNLYRTEALRDKYYQKFPDNLTFNYCMVMAISFYQQNAVFFPISWREEDQVSNVKMASQAYEVLKMLFDFMRSRKKFMNGEHRKNETFTYQAQVVWQAIPDAVPQN